MCGARGKLRRRNECLFCPNPRDGIQAVRHGLTEDHDIRLDPIMFECPELAGPEKSHLNFIVDQKDLAFSENLMQSSVIFRRRDDISPRGLDWLPVEGDKFGLV